MGTSNIRWVDGHIEVRFVIVPYVTHIVQS